MSRYDSDELATGCLFAILGVFLLILFKKLSIKGQCLGDLESY